MYMNNSKFRAELVKLENAGLTKSQIARIAGLSYTSVHRFMLAKDLDLTPERRTAAIEALTDWQQRIGRVCFTSLTTP
jgi:hypothetical protein